jgi:hypothetical protein
MSDRDTSQLCWRDVCEGKVRGGFSAELYDDCRYTTTQVLEAIAERGVYVERKLRG